MPTHFNEWSSQTLRQMRQQLMRWYAQNHRRLPWRETQDPYAIWVSEIMLQQTQVATVLGYYDRFLARFPNVNALATATENDVFALWAGLGYYRRARQMHAAAKVIVDQYEGRFPQDLATIQSLPGIGRYTAGAIASFAFDQSAPIVEANTARLFSRLMAIHEPVQERAAQEQLWRFAESLLPKRQGAGKINQAVIELGSQVCAPVPACDRCPLIAHCRAFASGEQLAIPVVKQKAVPTPLTHVALIVKPVGKLLLRQNEAGEWWHGLWDLPRIDVSNSDVLDFAPRPGKLSKQVVALSAAARQTIVQGFEERFAVEVEPQTLVAGLQHSVTRYRISLYCVEAKLLARPALLPSGWGYHPLTELPPLTSPAKRIVQSL